MLLLQQSTRRFVNTYLRLLTGSIYILVCSTIHSVSPDRKLTIEGSRSIVSVSTSQRLLLRQGDTQGFFVTKGGDRGWFWSLGVVGAKASKIFRRVKWFSI